MTQGKGNGGSLLPSTVTAWTRAPLELTRRAAEDIPLLPSQDHITLVSLAALTGLLAGLAAELLRVFVRLFGVLMFSPGSLWELATDRSSPMSQRFDAEWPKIDTHFMVVGLAAALLMFGWGYYRDHRNGAAEGHRSRSHQLGIAVGAAALAHGVLQVLVAAADAVTPGHSGLLSVFQHTPWWGLCGVALVGGIAVGVLAHYLTDARGEGVPIVMKSVALKSGAMRTRSGPIFAGTAGLTVASMGSVGLEGPVLVFGAASASGLGQALGLSRDRLRVLVAAGAAAGISAGFNAPIAGALFALEIVVGDFALATFSPVVIASVVGTVVHRSIEGNFPVFGGVDFVIKSSYEIWLYIPLGLLCGAVGTLFVRTVESTNARFQRLTSGVPNFLQPAIGLLAICLMAVALGRYEVLGSGYDTLQNLLNNRITATVVGVILVAKIAATSLTLASGGVGGVFFPSLMIGASAGSLFGAGAQQLLGDRIASPASYAIVGMGAVLTAVQHAPLTAVVMVFELCNDYNVILPLLVACILSTLVATRALGMSIYQRVLKREGIVLSRGKEQNLLRSIKVSEAMRTEICKVQQSTRLRDLQDIVSGTSQTTFPLVDNQDRLAGVISLSDMRHVMFEHGELSDLVVAGELGKRSVAVIHPGDSLADALEGLSGQSFEHLVVVDTNDERKVVGLLSHHAVMGRYRKALQQTGVFDRSEDESP